jgi:hypothetical protein
MTAINGENMKRRIIVVSALAVLLAACGGSTGQANQQEPRLLAANTTASSAVELAGNAFITSAPAGAAEQITSTGLANWSNPNTVASTYFRVAKAGFITVALDAKLVGSTSSTIRVTVAGTPFDITLAGAASKTYAVGKVNVPAGYVKVDLRGISKNGAYFGDVSALRVTAAATLDYADDAPNYYWSRRGPSVHLSYAVPANTEYFYNELTVPQGQDAVGSYFMTNGFGEGYMGIQVVSPSERWVIFSVWNGDTANVKLVKKGNGVVSEAFGGEGTGGKTYLVYPWVAGNTYKFITQARPDGSGGTDYSSWFFAPETANWRYIATWKRPAIATYLTSVYSFLENFSDVHGYLGRRASYGNQWARNASGAWTELTQATFTGDPTASNGQRLDYAGGLENGQFYLRNGGFFASYVPLNQSYTRPATGQAPTVNVNTLPR